LNKLKDVIDGYESSGVTRVPCALGQEIFLRLRQQKL